MQPYLIRLYLIYFSLKVCYVNFYAFHKVVFSGELKNNNFACYKVFVLVFTYAVHDSEDFWDKSLVNLA